MALTKKEKAILLFRLLEDNTQAVLEKLSPESIDILNNYITEEIEPTPEVINELFNEVERRKHRNRPATKKPQNTEIDTALNNVAIPQTLGNSFGSMFSQEEPEVTPMIQPQPGDIRRPEKIVSILSTQRPQIIAFILNNIPEEDKDSLLPLFTEDIRKEIETIKITSLKLSNDIFKELYQEIFIVKEEDLEEELNLPAEENEEPEEEGFTGFGSSLSSESTNFIGLENGFGDNESSQGGTLDWSMSDKNE
jgi:flagellar motor switch protein FliG